ncbi:uncharacterized protein FIBRA_03169 [Fibroporia radiculosa]|uniref:Uncharacterized protein n=1 Tax=Fibroporia radiculosa TaxID=599839 RepID=J4I9G5_9APHY|nr:uncharacterized protein FIBRA_03169 [Fibroporia radiculosa]CCM01121.1 predicted protein [Fibroporia radiculosa]
MSRSCNNSLASSSVRSKPSLSIAYRRESVPRLDPYPQTAIPFFYGDLVTHRAPLATLDPQSAHAIRLAADDQMSTSPSPPHLGYRDTTPGTAQTFESDHTGDLFQYNIIRSIRNVNDDLEAGNPPARRRSIPNHSQTHSITGRPLPGHTRLSSRRPSHNSVSSNRRPSLPTILLPPPLRPEATSGTNPAVESLPSANSFLSGADDLYSNLSSFTFGSARPNRPEFLEMISPLSSVPGSNSTDRTPRPSVSGAGSQSTTRTRTPRVRPMDMDDGCRADDEADDEAERESRAKMRAMNDGTRRPSLPMNTYATGRSKSPRGLPGTGASPSSVSLKSPVNPREGTRDHSESESEASAHFGIEGEGNDFDTDVEIDFPHPSTAVASHDAEMTDLTSSGALGREFNLNDSNGEKDHDFADIPVIVTHPAIEPGPSRGREDSLATLTGAIKTPTVLPSGDTHSGLTADASRPEGRDNIQGTRLESIGQALLQVSSPTSVVPADELNLNLSDWYKGHAIDSEGWGAATTGDTGRRTSIMTVGSIDAFIRHVQQHDPVSKSRAVEWSFMPKSVDTPSADAGARWAQSHTATRAIAPPTQETWQQMHVGQFKVDRLLMRPDDPSKSPSQRINVRHIHDPHSKGNTRGGPVSVVHKHSRAIAFSIFRKYNLFGNQQNRSGSISVPTSGSILLATRRVQEQYTSTRTTSQLNSHGLLRDGSARSRGQTSSASDGTAPSSSQSDRSQSKDITDTERVAKEKRSKSKASPSGYQTSSAGSVESTSSRMVSSKDEDSLYFAKSYASCSSSSEPSAPVSPTIAETGNTYPSSVFDSATLARHSLAGPSYSKYGSPPPTASTERTASVDHGMDVDDDGERVQRTSHAEAFATLDQNSIDYYRGKPDQRSSDHDPAHTWGFTERLRKLLGPSGARVRPGLGLSSAALEGQYTPPWMTMAPRSRVEERDRVIQNLNESFKDVGLLPSFKTKGIGKKKNRTTDEVVNIFSHVPPDSLYMILPLWPCETDPASRALTDAADPLPVEERQYLLVFYAPFDDKDDKDKKQENKKRTRSASRTASASASSVNSKTVSLTSFKISARLVSYHDLLGTGVRLPIDGLSVTGPMSDAMKSLPPPDIRDARQDMPRVVIGYCYGRNHGMEFLPEGLAKVGLARVNDSSTRLLNDAAPWLSEAEEIELNWEMTPIGRAAVEMAWLGCLAMTSFGPESVASR